MTPEKRIAMALSKMQIASRLTNEARKEVRVALAHIARQKGVERGEAKRKQ